MKLWAVELDGVIDGKTVHETPRGAKVNWLHVNGMFIHNAVSEKEIHSWFATAQETTPALKCIEVEVIKIREEDE